MASELPWDFLQLVITRLCMPHDVARFKSVCSWRSSSISIPPQFLGLILLGDKTDRRDFYSQLEDKVYKNLLRVPDDHSCLGNRDGWLITASFSTRNVCLLNPLSGDILQTVTFPSLTSLLQLDPPDCIRGLNRSQFFRFVKKVILSANPSGQLASTGRLTMMIIFGRQDSKHLAYAREGGEAWLVVQEVDEFEDIIYYRDGFYAVNTTATVFFVDIHRSGHTVRVVVPPVYDCGTMYLVESSYGELLLVSRVCVVGMRQIIEIEDAQDYKTYWFEVYQLDLKNQMKIKICDLGDQSLFLSINTSLSIPCPEKIGLKKNCIYFTDESGGGNNIDLFDLATENIERGCSSENFEGAPLPMWFTL